MTRNSFDPRSAPYRRIFYFRLLRKVARSFYFTIALLPQSLQEPMGLAYLLARASDTIADRKLEDFQPVDWELLEALPQLVDSLNHPSRDQREAYYIRSVWEKILQGQQSDLPRTWDLEALDEYLYLVAGSVGEFWTRMLIHHLPNLMRTSASEMINLGINYGKGLQLVNILRDRQHDIQQGRFYYLEEDRTQLYHQAFDYLKSGKIYLKTLSPGYFKMATAIPLLLAEETLVLMMSKPHLAMRKVCRFRLYCTLMKALTLLFF